MKTRGTLKEISRIERAKMQIQTVRLHGLVNWPRSNNGSERYATISPQCELQAHRRTFRVVGLLVNSIDSIDFKPLPFIKGTTIVVSEEKPIN